LNAQVPAAARSEVDELRRAVEHHAHRYNVRDEPALSDRHYALLLRRLVDRDTAGT